MPQNRMENGWERVLWQFKRKQIMVKETSFSQTSGVIYLMKFPHAHAKNGLVDGIVELEGNHRCGIILIEK